VISVKKNTKADDISIPGNFKPVFKTAFDEDCFPFLTGREIHIRNQYTANNLSTDNPGLQQTENNAFKRYIL